MTTLPRDLDAAIERLWCIGSTRKIAGLLDVDRSCVIRRAKKLGLKPSRHFWTAEEDVLLRELYPNTLSADIAQMVGVPVSSVHDRAGRLGLRKDKEWLRENSREVQRRIGNSGRFRKGLQPWNKGKKGVNGRSHTSFSPGHLPHDHKPIGHERTNREGYLERKVSDHAGPDKKKNFQRVHVLLWERHHGPVPENHIVVFKNRDKTDIRIENLELITRSENLQRNSAQRYPPDLRKAIAVKAWVTRIINQRLKDEEPACRSAQPPFRNP